MGEKIATSENVTVLHFSFKCFLVCFYEPKCSISNIGSGSLLYYNKNKQKPNLKTWSTYVKYKQDQQHEHQQSNSLSSTECGREVYIPMAPAETSETDYTQTAQGTGEADETNCQGERQKGRET